MSEYEHMLRSQRKWMLYLLAILLIGALVSPYQDIFFGLLLGTVVSLFNLSLLQRKVKAFGEAIVGKGPPVSLGTLTRMATAVLAIAIALRLEETFHVFSVIIGLLSSYVVLLVDGFFRAMAEANKHD